MSRLHIVFDGGIVFDGCIIVMMQVKHCDVDDSKGLTDFKRKYK